MTQQPEEDYSGLGEFGYEDRPETVDSPEPTDTPDEELDDDDDAYYGTYGYPRNAPVAEPAEYIVTDSRMTEQLDAAYVEALIEKYGDVAELCSTTEDDDADAPDYSEIDPEFYGYHPE